MSSETRLFLKLWLKRPLSIGTLTPSSHKLALAVARQVPMPVSLPVLELGAGTGAITAALLEVGVPADRLITVEREESLYRRLVARFPRVAAMQGDATRLVELLRARGIERVGAVVSGLPLSTMPAPIVAAVVDQSFRLLAPGGIFIQFTYSFLSPVPRRKLGLEGGIKLRVLANFPPANVWVYRRPETRAA